LFVSSAFQTNIVFITRGDCMPDEGSAADLQYALDQLASAPPPAPPADTSPDPVTPANGNGRADANGNWTGEAWEEYDGSKPLPQHNAWTAAKELAHSRRRRDLEGDGSAPKPIVAVQYQDGRAPDAELTAAEAAKDLSAYRQQTAQQLLAELTGEQSTPQPEAAPTPEPSPQYSPEQLEQAAQRQQAEQHTQAAWQASNDYQNLLSAGIAQLMGQGQEFADVKALANQVGEQAALAQLAEHDPARFARFQQLDGQVRQVQQELANIRTQQAQAYSQAYEKFAREHDAATEKLIPELAPGADPRAKVLLQQTAADLLKEVGYSDQELRHAWQAGGQFMLRDARAQKIIADAARWRISQARAKEAIRAPHPEVQRPGV
jgi:hypothetical protein